jgi:hypothetical protein
VAALVLGLAASGPASVWAQRSGIGLPSGSGSGTGTGAESGSGLGTTGTGTESGSGLGTTGTGYESPGRRFPRSNPYNLPVPPGMMDPGAGAGGHEPGDIMPSISPFNSPAFGSELGGKELSEIYTTQMARARLIKQPGERATAFNRIGESAVFTSRLREAHAALLEAREAILLEPVGLIRDQRLEDTITYLMALAEAQVREGITEDFAVGEGEKAPPGRRIEDRMFWFEMAETEWERAAELSTRITNPNFRSQLMFGVVKSQAGGSQVIANQVLRSSYANSNLVKHANKLNEAADRDLVLAAAHARLIQRPVWRDRALVEIAANAAISNQFTRGMEIARTVPQPEVRTDGLLRLAEAQARKDFHDGATVAYREAARAVAAIPQVDPRTILAGVLVDSLVSVGRFHDARACIGLFPDYSRQIVALGAIARSQASRGLGDSAREWIAQEAPAEYRSYLYRKVNDGILAAVDKNRSSALSNTGTGRMP